MKRKVFTKQNLRIAFAFFYVFILLAGLCYAYLLYNYSEENPVENKEYRIPYEALPDNCTLLITFPDDSGFVLYLDFKEKKIDGIKTDKTTEYPPLFTEHGIDYRMALSYELIAEIIDRVGGVELEQNDEVLRFTGVQVVELISVTRDISDIQYDTLTGVLRKISQNGFSKDDFSYIIEYASTDLAVPVCYDWDKYIREMCQAVNILR